MNTVKFSVLHCNCTCLSRVFSSWYYTVLILSALKLSTTSSPIVSVLYCNDIALVYTTIWFQLILYCIVLELHLPFFPISVSKISNYLDRSRYRSGQVHTNSISIELINSISWNCYFKLILYSSGTVPVYRHFLLMNKVLYYTGTLPVYRHVQYCSVILCTLPVCHQCLPPGTQMRVVWFWKIFAHF